MKVANPQGKGVVPVLEHLQAIRTAPASAKPAARLLADFCVSSLVLSAEFAFRPVVGGRYYLYWSGERWLLSLISPVEWGSRCPGEFAGCCELRPDMTWQITSPDGFADHSEAAEALARFFDAFVESLAQADNIADALPGYVANLPYYQRVLATGLTASVRHSAQAAGIADQSGRRLLASANANPLLPDRSQAG
jgi:hypothetical protein